MTPGGHVHIISAGESIHTAFPALLRTLPGIARMYIIADSETFTISNTPIIEKERLAVRNAVGTTKAIAASLAIPCTRELVFAPVCPAVRMLFARICRENPGARFTFDLTGGPKPLCMALFSLAPWLGGEVYVSFDGKVPQPLPSLGRDVRAMLGNVNYQTILAVLLRNRPVPIPETGVPFIPRQYLFSQVWPYYIRQRVRKPEPGKPVLHYKRGRKPANDLSQATFSWFMKTLAEAGLIEICPYNGSLKERSYRISESGETAFRFFADPATNSMVKMMLDGPRPGPGPV